MWTLFTLWQAISAWLGRPDPAAEPARDDDRRRSIRAVTLEQLGVSHWSCHPHF